MIQKFRLSQDETLQIIQKLNEDTNTRKPEEISGKLKKTQKLSENEERRTEETLKRKKITNKQIQVNFNEHMDTEKFKIDITHLSEPQKAKINKLIDEHNTIFARDKYDVHEYEARIDLTVDRYCSKRPYRCTMEDQKEIEEQISKLLKEGLIEESYSPFAAPVTLAFKKEENKEKTDCVQTSGS